MADKTPIAALFKLTPQEAVEYLQGRGQLAQTFNWQDMWQEEHATQFTVSRLANLDILEAMRDGITRNVNGDLSRRDWTKNAQALLEKAGWWGKKEVLDPATGEMVTTTFDPARLKLIFDTNTRMAYSAGLWQRIERNKKTHPYIRYITKRDEKVRLSHRAWDNLTLPVDHPFWQTHFPPNGWRCFPAGVEVRADAQIGLKTWYTGKMVQLKTRLGHSLTTTVNHPVLTRRGWLPASHLQKGDQLLCDSSVINSALVGIVHNEQPPARVENLFEALSAQGLRIVPMAADDFHGDALLRKPEIHVAGSDCHLMDEAKAAQQQFIGERKLGNADRGLVMDADIPMSAPQCGAAVCDAVYTQDTADIAVAGVELPGDGAFGNNPSAINGKDAALQVGVTVSGDRPSGSELALHPARVSLDDAPLRALGFTAPTYGDTVEPEQPPQNIAAAFGLFGQLLEANAGLIAADDIVEIGQFDFDGHVFDFQTETGLIVAGGVVVHNCRCRAMSISQAEYDKGLSPLGETLNKTAPVVETRDWVNKRTGVVERVPVGIDPGFGYNPGMAAAREANLANVALAKMQTAMPAAAAQTMREIATQPALMKALSDDFGVWAAGIELPRGELRNVGVLLPEVVAGLESRNIRPVSALLSVRDTDVLHTHRDGKDNKLPWALYLKLPELVASPRAVLLDTSGDKPALLFVFDVPGDRLGKLVAKIDYEIWVRDGTGKKERVSTNLLRSGKTATVEELKSAGEIIYGSL